MRGKRRSDQLRPRAFPTAHAFPQYVSSTACVSRKLATPERRGQRSGAAALSPTFRYFPSVARPAQGDDRTVLDAVAAMLDGQRVVLAVSGGADSMALLHAG